MPRTSVKLLLSGWLYLLAFLAHSAPATKYPAKLVEAKTVSSPTQEQFVDFEIVVELASDGAQKTLRLRGHDGMKILLWPGNYYSVIEYGSDGASLEYLSPQEEQDLYIKKSKKKRGR